MLRNCCETSRSLKGFLSLPQLLVEPVSYLFRSAGSRYCIQCLQYVFVKISRRHDWPHCQSRYSFRTILRQSSQRLSVNRWPRSGTASHPALRYAKGCPSLILSPLGIVGAHDAPKYSPLLRLLTFTPRGLALEEWSS
jgi:hypothetical protein